MIMPKSLLITADDYGVHDSIDHGIINCIHNIDCIDIIVTHDSSQQRIQKLIERFKDKITSGELRLGLHLTLNVGKPQYRDNDRKEGRRYLRAISKTNGRFSEDGSEFKHSSVVGIIANMNRLIKNHKEALKSEIRCQYESFKKYTDLVPAHVSSHNGVFSGHPVMYGLLKEVCLELDNLPIRCPSLIAYDPYPDVKVWRDNEQLLLTKKQLKQMKLFRAGKVVSKWMKSGQRVQFEKDVKNNEIVSTEFFVTHFYLKGSFCDFEKIVRWIRENEHPREHSYEMVAHPVTYISESEYDDMPRGIKTKKFAKRKNEYRTLSNKSGYLRDLVETSDIEVYKYP